MTRRLSILLLCLLQTFLAIAQTAIADSAAVDATCLHKVSVGMAAAYDNLNHLSRISFGSDKSAEYSHAASGEKLQVAYHTAANNASGNESTIDYIGPYILKDGKLDKYLFDGGYCTLSGGTPVFHFYSRDNLGNIRAVVSETGTIEQTTHYYPFGGVYGDVALNPDLQPYKYNGKELDRAHGLDWYDYGARMYDAAIGYWNGVDPLAEKYCAISPYTYCLNTPVNSFDPDGQGVWSRLAKGVFKISKAVAKNGIKSLNQTSTYYDIVSDVVEDYNTLTGKESTTWERIGAAASLASEALPVSLNDVREVSTFVKKTHSSKQTVKPKSINQLQKDVERGRAPKEIVRFDKPHNQEIGQEHVHFKNGAALNKDGSWKDGKPFKLSHKLEEYLNTWINQK